MVLFFSASFQNSVPDAFNGELLQTLLKIGKGKQTNQENRVSASSLRASRACDIIELTAHELAIQKKRDLFVIGLTPRPQRNSGLYIAHILSHYSCHSLMFAHEPASQPAYIDSVLGRKGADVTISCKYDIHGVYLHSSYSAFYVVYRMHTQNVSSIVCQMYEVHLFTN